MNFRTAPTRRPWHPARITAGRCLRLARGMTLIELLVVLTILAVLSVVAVVSTETVLRQGRFEATQRTLQTIEDAVLGPPPYQSEDGAVATAGFVADIGRLPVELAELWSNPHDLSPFEFVPASQDNLDPADADDADAEVVVPCGWRGPYLRLPVGATELLDGWGRPLETDPEPGEILAVRSLGADGLAGSSPDDPYSGELEVAFVDRYQTTIQVTVWQEGENGELQEPSGEVQVRLFGPKNGSVGVWYDSTDSTPWAVEFNEVPIGPHVIRAYVEETNRKSPPLPIHVHPLRSTSWKLVLPQD